MKNILILLLLASCSSATARNELAAPVINEIEVKELVDLSKKDKKK